MSGGKNQYEKRKKNKGVIEEIHLKLSLSANLEMNNEKY